MALAWLDIARYGDSSVFHADGPRFMWPWRDWVIEAYNSNMPFDQFTKDQIAATLSQMEPEVRNWRRALTSWNDRRRRRR